MAGPSSTWRPSRKPGHTSRRTRNVRERNQAVRQSLPSIDAEPPAECPLCPGRLAPAVGRKNRKIIYKYDCVVEFEHFTPKAVAQAIGLTPYQTRRCIERREPWHHHGKPVVAMPTTKDNEKGPA